MTTLVRTTPLALCLLLSAAAVAVAQETQNAVVIEARIADRWLPARKASSVTPFREERTFVRIAPLSAAQPAPTSFRVSGAVVQGGVLRTPPIAGADSVRFSLLSDGRVEGVVVHRQLLNATARLAVARGGVVTSDDTISFRFSNSVERATDRVTDRVGALDLYFMAMPEAWMWELVPVIRVPTLAAGARWVDTVNHSATNVDVSQSLSGVRTSRVVGDTMIAGRRHWIVADSMNARIDERFANVDRTIPAWVPVERHVAGTIRGRWIIDPTTRLALTRVDTAVLTGESVVRYPDGRVISAPIRYDRRRTLRAHTDSGFVARILALRASPEIETDYIGPASRLTPLLQRLHTVPGVSDSLLAVWAGTSDPHTASDLWVLLNTNPIRLGMRGVTPADPRLTEKLRERAAALGDSTATWRDLIFNPRSWTAETLRGAIIPAYGDPAGALARGLALDAFLATVVEHLMRTPPAITDSASRALSPSAYRYLMTELASSPDPNLRDVSLLARFVDNPTRYVDSIRARASRPSRVIEPALLLVSGVGAVWPGTGQLPMPAIDASWQEWQRWIGSASPRYSVPGPAPLANPNLGIRGPTLFGATHIRAIRVHEVLTGRRIGDELRRAKAAASLEDARTTYDVILRGLGTEVATHDDLVADLLSLEPTRLATARDAVFRLFSAPSGPPGTRVAFEATLPRADDALSGELIERALAYALGEGPSWRTLEQALNPSPLAPTVGGGGLLAPVGRLNTVIVRDNLPPPVAAKFAERFTLMSAAEWDGRRDVDMRRVYRVSSVLVSGPFVRVWLDWSERLPPPSPMASHGGQAIYYLMRHRGEWVVVLLRAGVS